MGERKGRGLKDDVNSGLGLRSGHDAKGRIMGSEGKGLTIGREGHIMNPTSSGKLTKEVTEGELGTPRRSLGLLINTLDVSREDTGLEVRRTAGNQNVVGMPVDGEDGGADGLLDVLADPPIVFLFKVADGDASGTAGNGELVTLGRPFDLGGSTVNTEDNQSLLPSLNDLGHAILIGHGFLGPSPDVSISVLRAGDDAVVDGIPVNAGDQLVVLIKGGSLGPSGSGLLEDEDLVAVGAQSDLSAILVKGVADDGASNDLLNISGRHVIKLFVFVLNAKSEVRGLWSVDSFPFS